MAGFGDGYVGSFQDVQKIRRMEKKREEDKKKMEELKKKTAEGASGLLQFGQGTSEILESAFKQQTVGLVTRDEFVEKRATLQQKLDEEEKRKRELQEQAEVEAKIKKRKKKSAQASKLSFAEDLDEDEQAEAAEAGMPSSSERKPDKNVEKKAKLGKFGKDPSVETGFLPDRDREAAEREERKRLRRQYIAEQERIKNEPLEITYSYWDGTGHRRKIQVRKGDSIGDFMRAVQAQLSPEFREVRTTMFDNLMYVKEDLIIPHQFTFYELIVNKARGKSGPLFHFDVHEDIRTVSDATKEKEESHAGKVVERHWYEKNKHIFPASRWEIYDPAKQWEKYTVHGGEIRGVK
ncbi:hypothetical protein KFL_000640250 [Klebsormidium nitens]|uniref:FAM50A/XAP5 C-terminal domain-containing protein n=1 Tax=Klebsormidium nitens TaxID=105231 RepID=A0A1Y1HYC5_KLENI|nr:hypothetical protein KFL_000640250 [Klebsormidium nitens]|eukprot:GAQ80858.1 hypothetical protein KFL_000640250 [Klebsormidium nitens]